MPVLSLTHAVAQRCAHLRELLKRQGKQPNRRAFDRIIAATAREYGYTVITSDRALLEYGKDGYLSVLEC